MATIDFHAHWWPTDRFVPFFSMDPHKDAATGSFSRAVMDWGMKGLKLYPPTGFYPDDPCCDPLYAICLDHGLPVVFHGTTSPFSTTPYCHPEGFVRLAKKYSALRIVIAHSGGLDWNNEAVRACLDCECVYLDISGFQSLLDPALFKAALETMYIAMGSFEKVLFGTDDPIFNRMCPIKTMVDNLRGLDIPDREKENLLFNAGKKLLRG